MKDSVRVCGGGGNYVTGMCRLFSVIVCTHKCGARRSNVKNKTGDVGVVNNYRPIALVGLIVISKFRYSRTGPLIPRIHYSAPLLHFPGPSPIDILILNITIHNKLHMEYYNSHKNTES